MKANNSKNEIDKMIASIDKRLNDAVAKAISSFTTIAYPTPVDTGNAIKNWNVSLNQRDMTASWKGTFQGGQDADGTKTRGAGDRKKETAAHEQKWSKQPFKIGDTIYLSNNAHSQNMKQVYAGGILIHSNSMQMSEFGFVKATDDYIAFLNKIYKSQGDVKQAEAPLKLYSSNMRSRDK